MLCEDRTARNLAGLLVFEIIVLRREVLERSDLTPKHPRRIAARAEKNKERVSRDRGGNPNVLRRLRVPSLDGTRRDNEKATGRRNLNGCNSWRH